MIIDSIERLARYSLLLPNYTVLSNHLSKNDINTLEVGKHTILNDEIFIIINEYETNDKDSTIWESHNQYIDIHLLLKGEESIGYSNIEQLVEEAPYNSEQDVTIYNKKGSGLFFILSAGSFCIFFPTECHKPGCTLITKKLVRKAVIKIKC